MHHKIRKELYVFEYILCTNIFGCCMLIHLRQYFPQEKLPSNAKDAIQKINMAKETVHRADLWEAACNEPEVKASSTAEHADPASVLDNTLDEEDSDEVLKSAVTIPLGSPFGPPGGGSETPPPTPPAHAGRGGSPKSATIAKKDAPPGNSSTRIVIVDRCIIVVCSVAASCVQPLCSYWCQLCPTHFVAIGASCVQPLCSYCCIHQNCINHSATMHSPKL